MKIRGFFFPVDLGSVGWTLADRVEDILISSDSSLLKKLAGSWIISTLKNLEKIVVAGRFNK